MYTKEIIKTTEGFGFRIYKDNILYHSQEVVPSREGFKPMTEPTAHTLADEMVEYLTIIDGQDGNK